MFVVTDDRKSATNKARDLINASLQRLEHAESLSEFRVDVTNATLVVGGGIAESPQRSPCRKRRKNVSG